MVSPVFTRYAAAYALVMSSLSGTLVEVFFQLLTSKVSFDPPVVNSEASPPPVGSQTTKGHPGTEHPPDCGALVATALVRPLPLPSALDQSSPPCPISFTAFPSSSNTL